MFRMVLHHIERYASHPAHIPHTTRILSRVISRILSRILSRTFARILSRTFARTITRTSARTSARGYSNTIHMEQSDNYPG